MWLIGLGIFVGLLLVFSFVALVFNQVIIQIKKSNDKYEAQKEQERKDNLNE